MSQVYRLVFPCIWLSWVVYWLWASRHGKPIERREPIASRLLHVLPLFFAAWLLWADRVPGTFLNERFVPWWHGGWFWSGALITVSGMLFTIWARVCLGRNWSAIVTIKQDHELIDAGPYALVRHPIYTGLLIAFTGTALAVGEWRGVLAVVIAWGALWRKLRIEERWMTERFGEKYAEYCLRVPALVPWNWN